jgi:hypothetical protein
MPIMIREKTLDCAGIVLAGALAALILRPFQDTPFIDDFIYAWSVEVLLRDGILGHPDYAVNVLVTQALWGALFSSLASLRPCPEALPTVSG